ncbi:hypothetical protein SOCE26_033660 [Sorangium cellulosum]|uniref:Uncharacterized protein n=1 Tax=Sorangium cellulosum TaxID=56 RepID=A0A2L0ERL1_SORCE|nr:hypothetical protein [Sorangium cellulosum]AUX41941.1 hypothetical protein SOCE26_033660 [Sorangium cellulosum]
MQASFLEDAAAKTPARKPTRVAALSCSLSLCGRLLLGLAAATAATFALSPPAYAAPKGSKSIAVHIEGPNAAAIRADILSFVPETLEVVSPDAFSKALRGAGQTKPAGDTLVNKAQRKKLIDRLRKAAKAAKVEGVIFGVSRTNKKKKKEVHLIYVDQNAGDLAVDEAVPAAAGDDRKKALEGLLGPKLAEIAPPPPEDEKKSKGDGEEGDGEGEGEGDGEGEGEEDAGKEDGDEKEEGDKGKGGKRKPHAIGSSLFSVELGVEFVGRWFDYSDPVTLNLRPYGVFGQPALSISGEIYPLASTDIPVLKGLGITAGYARALGLNSAVEGSDPIPTTYQRLNVGLRERIALGEASVLGISAGLRLLTFNIDASGELARTVPNVSYTLLRGGLDARVPVGPVALAFGADYLMPLSSGDVYERFAGASVQGIGVMGGVIVPIASGIEGRLLLDYARFFSSFSPAVGDEYVAGGATDQYLGIRLAGAYVH